MFDLFGETFDGSINGVWTVYIGRSGCRCEYLLEGLPVGVFPELSGDNGRKGVVFVLKMAISRSRLMVIKLSISGEGGK